MTATSLGPSRRIDACRLHHLQGFVADRLLDAGKSRAVAPLVGLATEGVSLELQEAELVGGEHTVAMRGVDAYDGAIEDEVMGGGVMDGGSRKGLGAERQGPKKRDPSVKTQNGACIQNKGPTKKLSFKFSRWARSTAL